MWIRPHIMFTDARQQRQPNHNTTTYCVYWRKTTTTQSYNMGSCYDWVVVVVVCLLTQYLVVLWLGCRCCRPSVNTICGRIMIGLLLTDHILCLLTEDNNDNSIIIRPHIVFTDGRQQRQPNHNTTTYYVYWRTTTTINPIIIRCGRVMIGLSLLSVSEHNMWSSYDWVVVVVFRLLAQYLVVTYCVYWRTTTTTQS
jgi:hypothetical protein